MRSIARLLGAAILALVVLTSVLRSHAAPTGSLRVMVSAGNPPLPLSGVVVRLFPAPLLGTSTNPSGIAVLQGIPPGNYSVRVSVTGQCTEQRNVTISAGVQTPVFIWLCGNADAVATPGDPPTALIAALRIRTLFGLPRCGPDRVIQGSNGVAPVGINALLLSGTPPCHGVAWVLTPDHAPGFSNNQADFPWTNDLGDGYPAKLPDRRLRVATTIWLSKIAPELPGELRNVLSTTILPKVNTWLHDNFSGILLVKDEASDAPPDIIDVATVATPPLYDTIGTDCDRVHAIKATPAVYHSDKLNIYYVSGVGYAGFTCYAEGAPNIIYIKAGGSYPHTLLHEIGHGLGLTRPDEGHTDNLPGFVGTGTDGWPSLNFMAPNAVAPDYLSVGQVIRMHADEASWLNAPSGSGSSSVRSRQTTGTPLVTRCGCPESKFTDDCPRLRADIARSGTQRTTVPSPMACYVKAPSCLSLANGTTSFDTRGYADAALTQSGSGGVKVFSLTPAVVRVALADPTVTVTRVGAGTGQLRVTIGGSYALVNIPSGACP